MIPSLIMVVLALAGAALAVAAGDTTMAAIAVYGALTWSGLGVVIWRTR
jgi:hypothetical protein